MQPRMHVGDPMSFIDPLARRLEHFIYDRVCALSELSRPQRGHVTVSDELATPFDESDRLTHKG